MVKMLNGIDGISCDIPAGAFYVFASVQGLTGRATPTGKQLLTDQDVANFFIEEAGVITIEVTSYGMSPHLCFSFATSSEAIERGCIAIAAAVALLHQ